jgi:hypothetical protein
LVFIVFLLSDGLLPFPGGIDLPFPLANRMPIPTSAVPMNMQLSHPQLFMYFYWPIIVSQKKRNPPARLRHIDTLYLIFDAHTQTPKESL